ncbi:MAG: lamin tail domain-containing protein, partial [bacterium]|nr:lamin tail domain-containing protein [bacterium]
MKVVFTTVFGFVFFFLSIGRAAASSSIVINEVLPNPSEGGTEWVELFNPTTESVDLSSWSLVDKAGKSVVVSSGMTIQPNGFIIVERGQGWLNDSGYESVSLKDSTGAVINAMAYGNGSDPVPSVGSTPGDGKSIGRQGDGGSVWVVFDSPTKGGSNPVPTPEPTPSPTPSPTPTPTTNPTPTPTPTLSSTPKPQPKADQPLAGSLSLPPAIALLPTPRSTPRSQEVLGTQKLTMHATPSPSPSPITTPTKEQAGPPWMV